MESYFSSTRLILFDPPLTSAETTVLMVVIAELKFMCVATFYVSMNFVPFIIPFLIYQAYALDS